MIVQKKSTINLTWTNTTNKNQFINLDGLFYENALLLEHDEFKHPETYTVLCKLDPTHPLQVLLSSTSYEEALHIFTSLSVSEKMLKNNKEVLQHVRKI
jgi:argonaute-like protein implicated in RNA metabolism and viral defense